ncbi:trypsin-like peptidase domain-containing protein [Nocardiopsis aegyptia]|uniref:trypsin-like peptidase domain-containing protein n=1 Tax=Nocardiopsis aegyptia TaxID=220378 RepID=UPI00366BCCAE
MIPPAPHAAPDWQLRIVHPANSTPYGAAVQVSPVHVVTCAHVVDLAVADAGPGSTVHLDAPRGGGTWTATGTVLPGGWWWKTAAPWDVAVLRLDRPGPAVPPTLAPAHRTGEAVRFVGFPRSPAGRWVTGRLVGDGGSHPEFTQIDTDSTVGLTVVRGYSGSGVRPRDGDTLIGIVTESALDGRVGWMIPMTAIPRVWTPEQSAQSGTARTPTARTAAETARAMTDLHTLLDADRRLAFYRGLDPRLRRRLRVDQDLEAFASALVALAHEQYGLLHDVLGQLEHWEEGSAAMRRVHEVAAPLLAGA